MGRPPIQHHKLHLKLPDDWEDLLDRVKEIAIIQAVGRASGGFLGNPTNGILILGAILGISSAFVGAEGAEVIGNFFTRLQNLYNAEPGSGEQSIAANAFAEAQRRLIEFFSPLGRFTPLP